MRTSILQKFASLVRQRNGLDRQIERLTGSALEPRGAAEWLAGELFGLTFSDRIASWTDGGHPVQTAWVRHENDIPSAPEGSAGTHWLLFLARSREGLPAPGEPGVPWEVEEVYLVPEDALPTRDWARFRICPQKLSAEQAGILHRLSKNHVPALER